MQAINFGFRISAFAAVVAALLWPTSAPAFPPAPDHLLYGLVRDEYGTPLMSTAAKVLLVATNGVQVATTVVPGLAIGVNFALHVPMDAGTTSDLYRSNVFKARTPFKLYVVFDSATNVPIQMTGAFVQLGQPAQQTRLDLSLGEDANGDGIPDAWEYAFLAALGLDLDLSALDPNADYAQDGRTLRQEFLLGNALFDPADDFTVRLVDAHGGSPILEFTSMTGRSYTVLGSSDLKQWTSLSFSLPSDSSGTPRAYYYAPTIDTVRLQVIQPASGPTMHFFRLRLQ